MALFSAFFRLIRWPNLLFIGLTQVLFYYFIIIPAFPSHDFPNLLRPALLICLTLSSVLIAAAGYIINDYFDLNIDRVNKPDKLVVEKVIKRRSAILWHWFLSGIGVVLGVYVSWKVRNPIVGLANLACVILLWFYSTTFKRTLLIGNVIISLLTAWVILVLYVCEFRIGSLGIPPIAPSSAASSNTPSSTAALLLLSPSSGKWSRTSKTSMGTSVTAAIPCPSSGVST